jgi:hypothetical protein
LSKVCDKTDTKSPLLRQAWGERVFCVTRMVMRLCKNSVLRVAMPVHHPVIGIKNIRMPPLLRQGGESEAFVSHCVFGERGRRA